MQHIPCQVQNFISYNDREVRQGRYKDDIRQSHNVWEDLSDLTPAELRNVKQGKKNHRPMQH